MTEFCLLPVAAPIVVTHVREFRLGGSRWPHGSLAARAFLLETPFRTRCIRGSPWRTHHLGSSSGRRRQARRLERRAHGLRVSSALHPPPAACVAPTRRTAAPPRPGRAPLFFGAAHPRAGLWAQLAGFLLGCRGSLQGCSRGKARSCTAAWRGSAICAPRRRASWWLPWRASCHARRASRLGRPAPGPTRRRIWDASRRRLRWPTRRTRRHARR